MGVLIDGVWKKPYEDMKAYARSLEVARADLWGINEVLHDKIKALEKGQEDLLAENSALRSSLKQALHNNHLQKTPPKDENQLALFGPVPDTNEGHV